MRNSVRFLILSLALLAAACSGNKPPEKKEPSGLAAMAKMANLAVDPLAQMSFEFAGNPSKEEIGQVLDKVLEMYGIEANNENRSSAGRVLVALRKEHGHSEMEILTKMADSPAEGKFEEAAAKISAAMNQ